MIFKNYRGANGFGTLPSGPRFLSNQPSDCPFLRVAVSKKSCGNFKIRNWSSQPSRPPTPPPPKPHQDNYVNNTSTPDRHCCLEKPWQRHEIANIEMRLWSYKAEVTFALRVVEGTDVHPAPGSQGNMRYSTSKGSCKSAPQ